MKLINRQISAVEETLEQVLKEYKRKGKCHQWSRSSCPLCAEFRYPCAGCPIRLFYISPSYTSCYAFVKKVGYNVDEVGNPVIPLEDIAGFLMSLKISLELLK